MSKFLSTSKSPLAIGICARCNTKVPYTELRPDGNSPGLLVCNDPGCRDSLDPWRLPARRTEDITLKHPRPDTDIAIPVADATSVDGPARA